MGYVRAIYKRTGATVFISERKIIGKHTFYKVDGFFIKAQHIRLDNTPHK